MARLYDSFGILVKVLPHAYDDLPEITVDTHLRQEWGIEEPTLEEMAAKQYVRRRFKHVGEGVYLESDQLTPSDDECETAQCMRCGGIAHAVEGRGWVCEQCGKLTGD